MEPPPRITPAAQSNLQQYSAEDRKAKDAENDPHQAQVQAHVTVQDVAEFVADDSLQFVPCQQFDCARGDADDRVPRRMPGRNALIPASLSITYACGTGTPAAIAISLDHVEQLPFIRFGRGGNDQPPA